MGLPSAQLGSLPSMNVPSSVPVVGVQKTPKIWEQALLGLLTQAAGSAVQQGIGNVMAQDYAEEPSTGWQKLLKGPKMDKQQKMQQTSLSAASSEAEKGRTFTKGENELSRGLTKSEAELSRKQAAQLSEQERALRNHLAAAERMGAMERLIASGQQNKESMEFNDTLAGARDRERYNLGVMDPKNIAQTKLVEAEVAKTEQAIAQQKALQALMSGGGKGGPGGQAPTTAPNTPQQQMIQDAANDPNWRPKSYPSSRPTASAAPAAQQAPETDADVRAVRASRNKAVGDFIRTGGSATGDFLTEALSLPPQLLFQLLAAGPKAIQSGVDAAVGGLSSVPDLANSANYTATADAPFTFRRPEVPYIATTGNNTPPTPDAAEQQVLQGAPYSVRAQEIRRKYGLPQ